MAWIRTGLALMAFGFVVARIGFWLQTQTQGRLATGSVWLGAGFVILGTVSNGAAAVRYLRVRRALVEGKTIVPGSALVLAVATALVVLGGLLVAYIVLL